MDEGNSAPTRIKCRRRGVKVSVQLHFAAIWFYGARNDIHQRAFSGAILADQCVNFTGFKRKIDAIKSDGFSKSFSYLMKLEDGHGLRQRLDQALALERFAPQDLRTIKCGERMTFCFPASPSVPSIIFIKSRADAWPI